MADIHLFSLSLQIRMHNRHMVIAADHISQRRQPLFYPLDLDGVGERVAQVLQFLVRCCRWHEEAFAVSTESAVSSQSVYVAG